MNVEKYVETERIRNEQTKSVCPYIDCNFPEAQQLCVEHCIGRRSFSNISNSYDRCCINFCQCSIRFLTVLEVFKTQGFY